MMSCFVGLRPLLVVLTISNCHTFTVTKNYTQIHGMEVSVAKNISLQRSTSCPGYFIIQVLVRIQMFSVNPFYKEKMPCGWGCATLIYYCLFALRLAIPNRIVKQILNRSSAHFKKNRMIFRLLIPDFLRWSLLIDCQM